MTFFLMFSSYVMLLKERTGGAFDRPVVALQSLKSTSAVDESAQTTTSFLRSTSSAPVAEVQNCCGGGVAVGTRCHLPNWYFQRSAYVVNGSMPPNIQMALVFGSLRKTKNSRAPGMKFGSTNWGQSLAVME